MLSTAAMSSNLLVCAANQDHERRRLTVEGIVHACKKAPTDQRGLPDQIVCILTYDGDGVDVIINYVLLIANLVVCVAQLKSGVLHHDDTPRDHPRQSRGRVVKAVATLVFVVAFQLLLCLCVGCVGISIIWCAMMGWIACEKGIGMHRHPQQALLRQSETDPIVHNGEPASASAAAADATSTGRHADHQSESACHLSRLSSFAFLDFVVFGALVVDLVGIVYYAMVTPAITTVAHICAFALGSLCWWLCMC
jgi:nitrate reductase NapE component